jgi:hypothetical protein
MKTFFSTIILFGIFAVVSFSTVSCKKDKTEVINEVFDTTGSSRLATQSFISDAHTTTGELIIYNKGAELIYVFKNFKTDDGPNLEVWLCNSLLDVIGGGYLNLGDLKGIEGDFYYKAPASTATFSYIVVWCTDFSVAFGHAFSI